VVKEINFLIIPLKIFVNIHYKDNHPLNHVLKIASNLTSNYLVPQRAISGNYILLSDIRRLNSRLLHLLTKYT